MRHSRLPEGTAAGMKGEPRVQKLYRILASQDMKDFLQTKFKGLVIPAS